MKRTIIIALCALTCLTGALYYAVFYSHAFAVFLLPKIIERSLPGSKVRLLEFKSRDFNPFNRMSFQSVDLILQLKDKVFELRANSVEFEKLSGNSIRLKLKDSIFAVDPLMLEQLQMDVEMDISDKTLKGQIFSGRLIMGDYLVEKISSGIGGTLKEITLKPVQAQIYGGDLNGDVVVLIDSVLSYNSRFQFNGVDVREMRSINREVFSQVDGKVNGKFRIEGRGSEIQDFAGKFDVSEGGQVKASLIGLLANYIPQSTQKQDLEALIKVDGKVPVEKAHLTVRSLNPRKIATQIDLESKKLNMDLNVGVDINLDASMMNLIGQIENLLKNVTSGK